MPVAHRRKVLVLADVGANSYHVGDEAVAQSAVEELAARGWSPVVVSHGQHRSDDYAGVDVRRGLTWPNDRSVVIPSFNELLGLARFGSDDAPTEGVADISALDDSRRVIKMIREVDAVLVAGGGNLSSRFEWLLYERLACLTVAGILGRPAAVSGQTFGPTLVTSDVAPIVEAMEACTVVGLRERNSSALGRAIHGTEVVRDCLDDAQFFAVDQWERAPHISGELQRVVATFAPAPSHVEPARFARSIAAELDDLVTQTGTEVVLVPHKAAWSGSAEDEGTARLIAAASNSGGVHTQSVPTARDAAELIGSADLVISSRYHPIVFALARSIPFLALASDDYGDVRLDGVSARWGLGGWTIPLSCLDPGELAEAAMAVWAERQPLVAHMDLIHGPLADFQSAWWDFLSASLEGKKVPPPVLPESSHLEAPDFLSRLRFRGERCLRMDAETEQLRCELLDERASRFIAGTHRMPPKPPRVECRPLQAIGRAVRSMLQKGMSGSSQ